MAHRIRVNLLLFVQTTYRQQLCHANDAIHRSPNFMTHDGEEIALGFGRFLRRGESALQLLIGGEQLCGAFADSIFQLLAAAHRLVNH
ncbi:MAG: hypothetical protein COB96_04815 [Planctomycetota bacterium]|nr:MAG: hypothetical protein COB96_04815 [Planctomycetota bacterium]